MLLFIMPAQCSQFSHCTSKRRVLQAPQYIVVDMLTFQCGPKKFQCLQRVDRRFDWHNIPLDGCIEQDTLNFRFASLVH